MTRINTNVSSLVAQKTLARSNTQLQDALTRLSTGLRINSGKDDPAGLIASEVLGSDIVSVQKAVTNSERANQIIATADSALGQVSSLLNDIRGLVSEAANTGALSDQQIAANQLQIDSSLQAIDRIAQTTSFQGRRLLDGSLDFLTTSAGTADIKAAGTFGTTTDAFATLAVTGGGGANSNVTFTAKTTGAGSNGYAIYYSTGAALGSESASVDTIGKTIEFKVNDATTANGIVGVVNNDLNVNTLFSATASGTGNAAVGSVAATTTAGGVNGNTIILTAAAGGPSFNNLTVILATGTATGAESATYTTATNTLTVTRNDNSTAAQVKAAIDAQGTFTSALTGNGLGTYSSGTTANVTTGGSLGSSNISDLRIDQANFGTASSINANVIIDQQATQGALVYSGGSLTSDVNLEVGGDKGFNVFNFGTGTTIAQIASALNLVSDATGVSATVNGSDLTLKSTDYGSDGFVSARALSGTFTTYDNATASNRTNGTDVALRINGVQATGKGLKASLNTSTLVLSFTVNSALQAGNQVNFSITGGGANFQLGPDVVSNQQARLGIQGVSTATLGGVSGTLFELRSGGSKSLANDVKGAAAVADEVVTSVSELRGRLGAFQKTTLDTNIATLNDTLANLVGAQSSIRDADFAAESANLTRAQILVQSGTSVLAVANQNPQNVLALLRNL